MEDGKNCLGDLLEQQKIVVDRVRAVALGFSTGLYLHGRPGTSKTYTVRTTLAELGARYAYHNGHLTPIGLFDLLSENREQVIVLDDVSNIFDKPAALQLLLAALGNGPETDQPRMVTYKSARGDRTVRFSGGIICVSNRSTDQCRQTMFSALTDRIPVIAYEPTNDQIVALIRHLAENGVRDVGIEDTIEVATFLIDECGKRNVRPSIRLFVDRAISDFKFHRSGQSETHWKDLISSNLERKPLRLEHPAREIGRAQRVEEERQVALEILQTHDSLEDRLAEWNRRTGRSRAALYRRRAELHSAGSLATMGGPKTASTEHKSTLNSD